MEPMADEANPDQAGHPQEGIPAEWRAGLTAVAPSVPYEDWEVRVV